MDNPQLCDFCGVDVSEMQRIVAFEGCVYCTDECVELDKVRRESVNAGKGNA